jgi:hypothetical protein
MLDNLTRDSQEIVLLLQLLNYKLSFMHGTPSVLSNLSYPKFPAPCYQRLTYFRELLSCREYHLRNNFRPFYLEASLCSKIACREVNIAIHKLLIVNIHLDAVVVGVGDHTLIAFIVYS